MVTFIVSAVVAIVFGLAGAYAGYKYGRSAEAKAQAILSAVKS